jgi:hypothetical protein
MAKGAMLEMGTSLQDCLGGITFLPKTSSRALQAADIIAYESFKHTTNQFVRSDPLPIRKLFSALASSKLMSGFYFDRNDLLEAKDEFGRLPPWRD